MGMVPFVYELFYLEHTYYCSLFHWYNLCKEKIEKLFFIMCLDCPKDLSGLNIDSNTLSHMSYVFCGTD